MMSTDTTAPIEMLEAALGSPLPQGEHDLAAIELLNLWRDTGMFCCIELGSDYNYVWDVKWFLSYESEPKHIEHRLRQSYGTLWGAIYNSALAAFGIRVPPDLMNRDRSVIYESPPKG